MKEPKFRIFLTFTHRTMLNIEYSTVIFDFDNYQDANEEYERLCRIQPRQSFHNISNNEMSICLSKLNPFIDLKKSKYMGGQLL